MPKSTDTPNEFAYSSRVQKVLNIDGDGAKYDSTNPLPVTGNISTSAGAVELSQYITHDVNDDTTNILYVGKEKNDGTWLIQKVDTTTGVVLRYANESNNSSYTTYNTAWAAITSLSYALIETLTGL